MDERPLTKHSQDICLTVPRRMALGRGLEIFLCVLTLQTLRRSLGVPQDTERTKPIINARPRSSWCVATAVGDSKRGYLYFFFQAVQVQVQALLCRNWRFKASMVIDMLTEASYLHQKCSCSFRSVPRYSIFIHQSHIKTQCRCEASFQNGIYTARDLRWRM